MRGARLAIAAAVLFSMFAGPVTGAHSQAVAAADRCTVGDAEAIFQATPVASAMFVRGQDHPGLLEALSRCQYRLFFEGDSYTFCEGDVIAGGLFWIYPYKEFGVSRAFAIADIALVVDRVWLNGVEQVLKQTAFKNVNHPIFGQSVYQSRAFVAQLPVGDYVSVWVSSYPGYPDSTATVTLHIVPRALC